MECRTSGVGVVNRSGLPWKQKIQINLKMLYSKQNWYPLHSASFTLVTQFLCLLQWFKHAWSFNIINGNSYKNKLLNEFLPFSKNQIYRSNKICFMYIHQYFFYGSQSIRCTEKNGLMVTFFHCNTCFLLLFFHDLTQLQHLFYIYCQKKTKMGIILFRIILCCTESIDLVCYL